MLVPKKPEVSLKTGHSKSISPSGSVKEACPGAFTPRVPVKGGSKLRGERKKKEGFSYRLLSLKEQKKLPGPLLDWLEGVKQNRGVHLHPYHGEEYLIISAGMKPNPGHRLELVGVIQERGAPGLLIREVGPEPGRMHPQVITYPCLVIRLRGSVPRVFHAGSGKIFTTGTVEEDNETVNISDPPEG